MDTIRTPPHNSEAEASVLGAIMLDQSLLPTVRAALTEQDFFEEYHRRIWAAITSLADDGADYDAVSVCDKLDDRIAQYAVGIAAEQHTTAYVPSHIDIIRRTAAKRRQIDIGTELVNRGFNCAEPEDIAAYGIAELSGIAREFDSAGDEPLDIFGDEECPGIQTDWLPPGIAEYAIDQARLMGVRTEMLAMGCIGAIAAAISDDFKIAPKANEPNWKESARLWIMTIAPPGSAKSASLKRALGPLKRIDELMGARAVAAETAWRNEDKVFQLRQKDQLRRKAKGEGYEEELSPPEKPASECIFVQDSTTEALGEVLLDNPRGVTFFFDEISQWLGSFDAYRNKGVSKDRALALQGYEGGPQKFNRIGRGRSIVPNWSYSVIGNIQADKLREVAGNGSNDGFFQRFMVVEVPRSEEGSDHTRVENAIVSAQYEETLKQIHSLKPGGESVIRLSPEAQAQFTEFYDWCERMTHNDAISPMMVEHLAKWKGLWPRLALVYHVWGCARAGKHPLSMPVADRTAGRVTSFLKRFLLPQSRRFYHHTMGSISPTVAAARGVCNLLLAHSCATITVREMTRGAAQFANATEWQRKAAISMLKDSSWIREGSSGTYVVNPVVHVKFTQRAAVEVERRRKARILMGALREAAEGV